MTQVLNADSLKLKKISNLLIESNLNWEVEKQEIVTSKGLHLTNDVAIVRTDTNQVLGVRGSNYQTFQNSELAELLFRLSEKSGLHLHKGGYFGKGEKVYIQLKSADLKLDNSNGEKDEIRGFLTGISSHDGSKSLSFGNTNVTVSCSNSFNQVYKSFKTRFKHTSNMNAIVDNYLQEIEAALAVEKLFFADIKRLQTKPLTKDLKNDVIRTLFNIDKNVDLRTDISTLQSNKEISTRTANMVTDFEQSFFQETKQKGENLWGLFSAVTHYTTHKINVQDRFENKLFGAYGETERKIFTNLSELVH